MLSTVLIFANAVTLLLRILGYILIADAILSWILPPFNPIRQMLGHVTGPLIAPFRPLGMWIMQKTHIPLDFSGILAYVCLQLLSNVIMYAVYFTLA